LILRQLQPDAAAAHVDGALHGLATFEIQPVAALLGDLE